MRSIINCVHDSSKRASVLRSKGVGLKKLCETRWVARIESVATFVDSIVEVRQALIQISSWESSGNAYSYSVAIVSTEFLVSCVILKEIGSLFLPASVAFQSSSITVADLKAHISSLTACIESRRTDPVGYFQELFEVHLHPYHPNHFRSLAVSICYSCRLT